MSFNRLGLAVNEISKVMNKGRHTTVTRQMFAFEGGGYVAIPRAGNPLHCGTEAAEIDAYFQNCAIWSRIASSAIARISMSGLRRAGPYKQAQFTLNDMTFI